MVMLLEPRFLNLFEVDFEQLNASPKFSFNDFKVAAPYKLKSLVLRNFRNIHGTHTLHFHDRINIVMPKKFNDIPIEECDEFNWLASATHTMYGLDVTMLLDILRGKQDFEELEDFSYFADSKEISVEAELLNTSINSTQRYIRRKIYRDSELASRFKYFNDKGDPVWDRTMSFQNYASEINSSMSKVKVYPEDIKTRIWRVGYEDNFDYLNEDFPNLDHAQLIEDFNIISEEYGFGGFLGYDMDGKLKYVSNSFYTCYGRYGEPEDTLKELALVISIEKQIKSDVVILGYRFGISRLHEQDLSDAINMLREFDQSQQIITFYNNPYFIWDWMDVCDCIQQQNHAAKRDGKKDLPYKPVWFTEEYKKKEDWEKTTIKQAARVLIRRQQTTLEEKERIAIDIVKSAILHCRPRFPMVATSFGKDSIVLESIVLRAMNELKETYGDYIETYQSKKLFSQTPEVHNPIMEALQELYPVDNSRYYFPKPSFCNGLTGIEFPNHRRFSVEQKKRLEKMGYDVYEAKPETNFFEIVRQHGFPMFGKSIRKDSHPEIYNKIVSLGIRCCFNKCCSELKEKPAKALYDKLGVDLVFTGLLAKESQERRKMWYRMGDYYWNVEEERYKCVPLMHFSGEDIFAYIEKYKEPLSPIYNTGYWRANKDGSETFISFNRNGCWPCSMNIGTGHSDDSGTNIELLRECFPKLWKLLMEDLALAKEIAKYKKNWSEDKWDDLTEALYRKKLAESPCYFDTV